VFPLFRLKKRDGQPRTDDFANSNAKRLSITLILAVILPSLILWAVAVRQFRQITDIDAMDYAQVARNVGAGRGFTTNVIRPLATTHSKEVMRMPDMVHPPLFAYAEALVMAVGSAGDPKAFIISALFFLLTIPVLYVLTGAMFNVKVAQLAVLAYVTSLFMTNMVLSCGPATMTGFMFTSLCLMLFRYAQAAAPETGVPKTRAVFTSGALCGLFLALCYLTDYMLLFAFIPVAVCVYVAGKREGMIGLLGFLAAFAVFGGGWMVRNTMLTGNPFFGMRAMEIGMATKAHPGMSLYRTTVPQTVLGLLQETKGDLPKKILQGVQVAYGAMPVLGQPYLVAFFIVGLFYAFRRNGVNALRGMVIASLICVAVFGNLFLFQLGTLTAFAPIMLAFAAAFFVRLLSDAKAPEVVSKAVSTLAVVVLMIPLAAALVAPNPTRVMVHDVEGDVGRRILANIPVLTDRAFEMTWYGARTTVWLPDTEKDVENLDKIGHLKAIYLSANLAGARGGENYDIWRGMYSSIAAQAMRGQFARIDSGSLKGFALYRDMQEDRAGWYMQNGALLLTRVDTSRPQ
jgi:hypothetical protein